MTTAYSDNVTNARATPPTNNDVSVDGGRMRCKTGSIALGTGDLAAADIIVLDRLPTNAVIHHIWLMNDDLGTTLTVDVGVYTTGGEVKDVDAYATAVSLATASTSPTDVAFEARDIANKGNRLWQDAGDTSDPGGLYDIAATVASSTSPAAGDLTYEIVYTID